jgi:hypothetical protein
MDTGSWLFYIAIVFLLIACDLYSQPIKLWIEKMCLDVQISNLICVNHGMGYSERS